MRYIRTKDGKIYAFYDIKEIGDTVIGYVNERDKNALDGGSYFNKKDIRVADTIKELIDEYVAIKDNGKPFVIKKYEIHSNLQLGFTIYGSIWVNGNLIKVTKLNSRGELELLWLQNIKFIGLTKKEITATKNA